MTLKFPAFCPIQQDLEEGNPAEPQPEPRGGRWNADLKDSLEARLHHLVCDGKVPLAEAQSAIRTNWIAAYHRYMNSRAKGNRSRY